MECAGNGYTECSQAENSGFGRAESFSLALEKLATRNLQNFVFQELPSNSQPFFPLRSTVTWLSPTEQGNPELLYTSRPVPTGEGLSVSVALFCAAQKVLCLKAAFVGVVLTISR